MQRDEAKEKSYPHQAAKENESFVELEFDDTNKVIKTLTKNYDHKTRTKPSISDEAGFEALSKTFVIRPYLRYMEIIDFVYKSTGYDKYKQLAAWMGFEGEFAFQEKLAVNIPRKLKEFEKQLMQSIATFEGQIKLLINNEVAIEIAVLNFCNEILKRHNIAACQNVNEVWGKISEINKLKSASSVGVTLDKLARAEVALAAITLKEDLSDELATLEKKISDFKKEQKLVDQIDIIGLYAQALEILTKQTSADTKCPVCGTEWKREGLVEHIKGELELLKKTNEDKEEIERAAASLKTIVRQEAASVKNLTDRYGEVEGIIAEIKFDEAKAYLKTLNDLVENLPLALKDSTKVKINKEDVKKIFKEKDAITEQIKVHKAKIQPSAAESKLADDVQKLIQAKSGWQSLEAAKAEQEFASKEINKFYALKDDVVKTVQENIKARFNEISNRIGQYFGILRDDKDIKDIKVVLNEDKGKAVGRSAEIELSYYDILVHPAYKVLSESLLNSLGLAVYFTCVKQFNTDCKFIVLDDIMNSLDIEKRDTLLDLIEQEFSDYQIILFTHDYHWFQKILKRFPNWIGKKIKGWDYVGGPKIETVITTKTEIDEYLADSTKTEAAGWLLERHVEGILNELCEDLSAEVRYRYNKNDPPSMEELFDALYKRLNDKAKNNSVVAKVLETKKYEPILRNFVSHARTSTIDAKEVKRAADEWFSLEGEFWCDKCKHFVEYDRSKDTIECRCGDKKIQSVAPPKASKAKK